MSHLMIYLRNSIHLNLSSEKSIKQIHLKKKKKAKETTGCHKEHPMLRLQILASEN